MNMYRFILKISVLSLVLLNATISFGMIVKYKDEQRKKSVQASIASCLKPIDAAEKKKVKALPLEEQGRYNLEKLYKNRNNSAFVQKFLSDEDNHVPVLPIDCFIYIKQSKEQSSSSVYCGSHLACINPYMNSFYGSSDKQLLDQKIVELGYKKINKVMDQKEIQYPTLKGPKVIHNPLIMASLFGENKDIELALNNNPDCNDMADAVIAAVNYPNQKNEALKLLFSKIKQDRGLLFGEIESNNSFRIFSTYRLLCLAVKNNNKDLFEFITNKDPFNAHMLSADLERKMTVLDLMIDNKEVFGQENIGFLRANGGMTSLEVEDMEAVGEILKDLPLRRIPRVPAFEREVNNIFARRDMMARNRQLDAIHVTEPNVD